MKTKPVGRKVSGRKMSLLPELEHKNDRRVHAALRGMAKGGRINGKPSLKDISDQIESMGYPAIGIDKISRSLARLQESGHARWVLEVAV